MKITFKRIIIDNFLSFGHAEVDLENRGYTLIEGINQNPADGAKSNGAGKSTIFSALCFALTGKTIQGLSSGLTNIITKEPMSVTLSFSVDNDDYEITRGRTNSGDSAGSPYLNILQNGVDKSGKTYKDSLALLETLLPELNDEIISQVIIIGQGMPNKFSRYKSADRKNLLEKLSNSEILFEDIKARVSERQIVINDKLMSLQIDLTKKQTEKQYAEQSLLKLKNELLTYENKPDFATIKADIETALADKQALQQNIKNAYVKAKEEYDKITLDLINLMNDKNNEKSVLQTDINKANLSLQADIATNKSEYKILSEHIAKQKAMKDVCPMCGQKLPHSHNINLSVDEDKLKILSEAISKQSAEFENKKLQDALNLKAIEDKYNQREQSLRNDISKYKVQMDDADNNQRKLAAEISTLDFRLNKIKFEEEAFDKNKATCENNIKELEIALASFAEQILYINREQQDVEQHQEVLAKISSLVGRDFRGVLLSNVISYIDSKCKDYAKAIFGTDNLDFKLSGNDIDISYLNKPLEALSGGEQQKVDLIIQFAIRAMLQEYTGFTSNILVLDEILDNLDAFGCDAVLSFVTNRLSDIESVFIISHHADSLNIGNDSTIQVIKDERGVSRIL